MGKQGKDGQTIGWQAGGISLGELGCGGAEIIAPFSPKKSTKDDKEEQAAQNKVTAPARWCVAV